MNKAVCLCFESLSGCTKAIDLLYPLYGGHVKAPKRYIPLLKTFQHKNWTEPVFRSSINFQADRLTVEVDL